MANRKISEFTALTAPDGSDVLAIIDQSESGADKNKKITYANLLSKIPDGSVASPSLSFLSDQNTGISGGSDTLTLSTGGTAAISVDSSQNVTLSANLTVSGTTTTINTTNLDVEDKNITLAKVSSPSDTTADGGGITIKGATDKTFNWVNSTDAFTSSEHIHLGDSKKLLVGDNSDLELFHDSSNSYISDSGTGALIFKSNIYSFRNTSDNAQIAIFNENAAVDLYFDGSEKLATTSTGVTVTGTLLPSADNTGDIGSDAVAHNSIWASTRFRGNDDVKLVLGDAQDLQIWHDASNSWITNTTGNLIIKDTTDTVYVQAPSIRFQDDTTNEDIAKFISDGGVELYCDNSKKFETTSTGTLTSGTKAEISATGASDEPQLKITSENGGIFLRTAGSSGSFPTGGGGDDGELLYLGGDFRLGIGTASKNLIFMNGSSYNERARINSSGSFKLPDNGKIELGGAQTGSGDLQIYHDGSYAILDNDTGDTYIKAAGMISLNPANSEDGALIKSNGAVELMWDNAKKLETQSAGVQVDGQLVTYRSGGNAHIVAERASGARGHIQAQAAKLVFGSTTNHDLQFITNSNGRLTLTTGGNVQIPNDSGKLQLGASQDVELYHDSSNTHLDNNTGHLFIRNNVDDDDGGNIYIQAKSQENSIVVQDDDGVSLYFDGTEKIATISSGARCYGDFILEGELNFMGGSDATRYIDAQVGDGNALIIRGTTGGDSSHETLAEFTRGGAVELYYDNSKKLETTNNGILLGGSIYANDNTKLILGTGEDLKIYHDESDSYISQTGSGNLIIQGNGTNNIAIRGKSGEEGINVVPDGAVELYYDNVLLFSTKNYGATVKRPSGGATVFEVIGCEGQNAEINMASDDGDDNADAWKLKAAHVGNAFTIESYSSGAYQSVLKATDARTIELHYQGSKKLETTSSGITVTGSVTETSDVSLKNDINTIQNPLELIEQIRGINFTWKNNGMKSMGVIAQDVEKVFPELVHGSEGSKSLQYSGLIGALVESVKELSAKVNALEAK